MKKRMGQAEAGSQEALASLTDYHTQKLSEMKQKAHEELHTLYLDIQRQKKENEARIVEESKVSKDLEI